MIWFTNSGYSKDARLGSIFKLKNNELDIRIHKYVGCGDNLFLSCPTLRIDTMDLETEDFDEAVRIAKNVINKQIYKITEEAKKFYLDEDENYFTVYE